MEKGKGNKKRVEIEKNYRSTLVILALEDKEKYLREIERELKAFKDKEGASKTNINDELIDLVYEGILKRKPKKNKIFYKVDWNEMCRHFIRYVSKLIKKRYKEDPFVRITGFKKNKYLIELIKISFKSNFELFKKKKKRLKTIGEIFEEIIYEIAYYLQPHEEIKYNKKLLRKKDMKAFAEFSKRLYKVLGEYKADNLGHFFDEHMSTKIVIGTAKKNN